MPRSVLHVNMAATMKKMQPFVWCIVAFSALSSLAEGKPKYVQTKLNTKWAATPLLLEASEFIAKESNDLFWNFVNDISELEPASIEGHEESMYHLALKIAGRYLSPLQLQLLKFSLSIRAHSPAVEMFNMIARQKSPPASCKAFIDVHSSISCDIHAAKAFINVASESDRPVLIKSDHQYPRTDEQKTTVILYGQLGTPEFSELHKGLQKLALDGKINYVLRHFVKNTSKQRVRLSGYGVELAIKNQEYKAKDDTKVEVKEEEGKEDSDEEVQGFVFSSLKKLHPESADDLNAFKAHLEESDDDMNPLKVWQLQDLSFQAAQRVMAAPKDEALKVLEDLSQNFPMRARALAKVTVNGKLRSEILKNQRVFDSTLQVGAGESTFLVNGQQIDMDVYDVFSLLDFLKTDGKMMEGLHALGFRGTGLSELLTLEMGSAESNYAVDIRDPSIVYVNNIEKDRKYSNWPSSMQEMLRPTFPGMLRHVRKNFFHMVFIVNPADPKHKELLKMAEAFYVHSAPIRVGIVFVVDQEEAGTENAGVALLQAFSYISKQHSGAKALSFITDVYEQVGEAEITPEVVMQEFEVTYPSAGVTNIFGANSDYDEWRKACHDYLSKTGLGGTPQVLINGIPLRPDEIRPDNIEEAVVSSILRLTPEIQKAIYNGKMYDGMDILEYMMTQPSVMPRLNARVLSASQTNLDFTKDTAPSLVDQPNSFKNLPNADMTGAVQASMTYLSKKDEASIRPVTIWVVADIETPEGRQIAYSGVKHLKHSNNIRLGFVHNQQDLPIEGKDTHFITKAVHVAVQTLEHSIARSFVTKLLKEENVAALSSGEKSLDDLAVNKMDMDAYKSALQKVGLDFLTSHQKFCSKVLAFQAGDRGVVSNGKLIGPLRSDEEFLSEDFSLLEKYTATTSADKIMKAVKKNMKSEDSEMLNNLAMRVSSLLNSAPRTETRRKMDFHTDQYSVLHLPGNDESPAFDIAVVLDPLSKAAQKYASILMVLQRVFNTNIRVFLNSKEKLSEAPLKVFYRFVLEDEVSFSVDSENVAGPVARFNKMPQKPLFTLGLDAPESWLVESVRAPYDLDNLYLEEVSHGVNADFELEYLLLEGHCYDSGTGQPPRGLQFVLGTASAPAQVDTIVMANLGYFQLKANPGAWQLQLRPGRSVDIYDIISHDYTDSPSDSPEVLVVMDSFKSKIIKVRVNKKAGREKDDLLGDETETGGIWDSISRNIEEYLGFSPPGLGYLRSFSGGTDTEKKKDETLNIFSVASGHLYERFLRIMMISVLKNTQSKVKFWFLKNFLSPTFTDFIPEMAKEYKFEYELVQYKWPRWLHQQTEKQRIIWGYKILFLDVLFPLHVDKFIFVDADQIVRTDLKELNDLDLEGAPYGYTPFCDSKREMDGFRFWKSGYWASHLAGRRYHISALYVVDLKKFRKIAAGDRLRGQYQGLSQDPNSLSNLDQDLPNNMIHQVAIKSLPQEWLWCETWCSNEQKKYAKTIDLCNNPLTKEPKLEAAMRIVPEWNDYDREIKKLWDRVQKARTFIDEESAPTVTLPSDEKDEL